MKFLEEDNFLARLLSLLVDLVLLNIMWLVCCLPIITIGASTAALYDQCLKLAYREEPSVLSGFFKSFASNFKRSTGIFLIIFFTGAFLAVDFWCALKMPAPFKFILQVLILSVGYFWLCLTSYVFAVAAYFKEPVIQAIRHAFILAMRNGIYTVFIVILDLVPFFVFFLSQALFWRFLFLFMTLIFAMIAYMNSLHMSRLFDPEKFQEMEEELRQKAHEKAKAKKDE